MPRTCAALNCRTGYASEPTEDLPLFSFPHKNEELLRHWLHNLNRKDFKPSKYTRLCSKHFSKEDILTQRQDTNPHRSLERGTELKFQRLKPNAVPMFFEGIPAHLIKVPRRPPIQLIARREMQAAEKEQEKKEQEKERKKLEQEQERDRKKLEQFAVKRLRTAQHWIGRAGQVPMMRLQPKLLSGLEEVEAWIKSEGWLDKGFQVWRMGEDLTISVAGIGKSGVPALLASACIRPNLEFSLSARGVPVKVDRTLFGLEAKLPTASHLKVLMGELQRLSVNEEGIPWLEMAQGCLSSFELQEENDGVKEKAAFLKEQIHLLKKLPHNYRFTPSLINTSSKIYMSSPLGYERLLASGKLTLPGVVTLLRMAKKQARSKILLDLKSAERFDQESADAAANLRNDLELE